MKFKILFIKAVGSKTIIIILWSFNWGENSWLASFAQRRCIWGVAVNKDGSCNPKYHVLLHLTFTYVSEPNHAHVPVYPSHAWTGRFQLLTLCHSVSRIVGSVWGIAKTKRRFLTMNVRETKQHGNIMERIRRIDKWYIKNIFNQ